MPQLSDPAGLFETSDQDSTDYRMLRGELQHRCWHCGIAKGPRMARCTGCNVVRYCSREHQIQHRDSHKKVCNAIRKARAKVAGEDAKIRNATSDFWTPANAFETHVGQFWGLHSTRPYMRARFELNDLVKGVGTLDGVQEGLGILQDLLHLCRKDNLGVRYQVPGMMIQLDRDQEAYDFVKWYAIEGERAVLNVKNADVLEDVAYLDKKYGLVHHIAAILLIKLQLVVDIINVKLIRQILMAKRIPVELWRTIELAVLRSPLSAQFVKKSSKQLVTVLEKLQKQIRKLVESLNRASKHFIGGVLDADDHLSKSPSMYSPGSLQEMEFAIGYIFPAWIQTEGVHELMWSAKDRAEVLVMEETIPKLKAGTFDFDFDDHRSGDEILDEMATKAMWDHLDWAVNIHSRLVAPDLTLCKT